MWTEANDFSEIGRQSLIEWGCIVSYADKIFFAKEVNNAYQHHYEKICVQLIAKNDFLNAFLNSWPSYPRPNHGDIFFK